ncbi:MAG: hypothetical protein NC428_12150, partial [Clostridium sp.]|nr:hypothetical protein [Clostridium sp.]
GTLGRFNHFLVAFCGNSSLQNAYSNSNIFSIFLSFAPLKLVRSFPVKLCKCISSFFSIPDYMEDIKET